jgi:hypothetical protein
LQHSTYHSLLGNKRIVILNLEAVHVQSCSIIFGTLTLDRRRRSLSTTIKAQDLTLIPFKRGCCNPTAMNTLPRSLLGPNCTAASACDLALPVRVCLRPLQKGTLQRSIDLTKQTVGTRSFHEQRCASTHVQSWRQLFIFETCFDMHARRTDRKDRPFHDTRLIESVEHLGHVGFSA